MTLKELREAAGLSASKVAKELGVDISTIFRWENGSNGLPADAVPKLARLYKTTILKVMAALPKQEAI